MRTNNSDRGKVLIYAILTLAFFAGCGPRLNTINGSIDDRNCGQHLGYVIQKGVNWTRIIILTEGSFTGNHWHIGREIVTGEEQADGVFLYSGGSVSNITRNVEMLASFCVISNRVNLVGGKFNIESLEKGLRYYQIRNP